VAALEKAARAKEEDYKAKIQQLEKVFDKLQGRIEELQAKKREEAKVRLSHLSLFFMKRKANTDFF
jgi:hypothetical protein